MARDSRRKTQREQVDLRDQRPTQLDVTRRYFQAGGFDKNVRLARALESALKVGADSYIGIKSIRNEEDRQRATNERAAGMERDVDEKSRAYHRQWDALNADYDFQQLAAELPEKLREANWEELNEKQVSELISGEMQYLFAGIENMSDSTYASTLAPKLLELEAKLVAEHRQMGIEKIHEEQRTQSAATFKNDYVTRMNAYREAGDQTQPAPLPDYQTLFDRTGAFFDGSVKKTVFWETVYDLAIQMGDSSIIDSVPPMMNGVRTGIEDPALADSHRAARSAADNVAAKRLSAAEAAQTEAYKRQVFDLQYLIAMKTINGEDTTEEIRMLRNNPEGTYSQVISATTFADKQLDRGEIRAARLPDLAKLWQEVHSSRATLQDVMDAWEDGVFGYGPQAVKQMKSMMDTVRAVSTAGGDDSTLINQTRTLLLAKYNPAREGLLKGLNPDLLYIQNEAGELYNRLVYTQGVPPLDAAMQVKQKFDPLVTELTEAESSSEFAVRAGLVTAESAKALINGQISVGMFVAGQTPSVIEDSLARMVRDKELTPEEAGLIFGVLETQ